MTEFLKNRNLISNFIYDNKIEVLHNFSLELLKFSIIIQKTTAATSIVKIKHYTFEHAYISITLISISLFIS